MAARLKVGDITLKDLVQLSLHAYRTKQIDDKSKRAKLDIIGGKVTFRRGLTYDQSTKDWKQTGREVRVDFLIRSEPVSYKRSDDIHPHRYPITFLFKDFLKGFDSPVRIRVGSNKKPKFPSKKVSDAGKVTEAKTEKEKEKIRKAKEIISNQNNKIMEWNIRNGIQLQFFFQSMYVYKQNGVLFGVNYATRPPKETNPKGLLFLSKHEYFIVTKLLPNLFNNPTIKNMMKNVKND